MSGSLLTFLAAVFCLMLLCTSAFAQKIDVAALNKDLEGLIRNGFAVEEMYASPVFKKLVAEASETTLFKLIGEKEYHRVPWVSFYAIKAAYPKSSIRAAVELFRRAEHSDQVFAVLWSTFEEIKTKEILDRVLDELVALSKVDIRRALLVVGKIKIPTEQLNEWFHSEACNRASIEVQCLVIEKIAYEHQRNGKPISKKILKTVRLAKGADSSWLRVIYAVHAPEKDEGYLEHVKSLIEDPEISDTELIALSLHKANYISKAIDIESLDIASERRALISQYLQIFLPLQRDLPISQLNACITTLRMHDAAKEQWAMANRKTDGEQISIQGVFTYITGEWETERCPAAGRNTYTLGKIRRGSKVLCSWDND